jgi:hypothetical protein
LCKFSKPLYIQKSKFYSEIILLKFRPIRPSLAHAGPLGLSSLGVFDKRRLFFEFAQSVNDASSLSCRCQVGLAHQFHPLPRTCRRKSRLHRASPHLIAPRLPASIIETPIKTPYSPALIPPLESLLTPPRPSLVSAVNHRPLLTGISTPSSPGPL